MKNIQTFSYCKHYNQQIEKAIQQFCHKNNLHHCDVLFDDLIEKPATTIEIINGYLGSHLSVENLKTVYNKPLYKKETAGLESHCNSFIVLEEMKSY